MATLVTFHAHPDDEASQTAGLMAKAAAAGHRVVLVTATDGAHGEIHTELDDGETLASRRELELAASAEAIGIEPPIMLGYGDSGMEGTDDNDDPDCFWQADVETAAQHVAGILRDVDADVITIYDDHGGYGHPDHLQVHRVGRRAAELAGVGHVYEVTMNRDLVMSWMAEAEQIEGVETPSAEDFATVGTPEADISFVVEAQRFADRKRAALRAHASQIPDDSFFLAMPDEVFADSMCREHYNIPGLTDTGGPKPVELLPGLDATVLS